MLGRLHRTRTLRDSSAIALTLGACWLAPVGVASAQYAQRDTGLMVRQADPRGETLMRMSRRVSLDVTDQRLEDLLKFIADFAQVELDIAWQDDRNTDGLEKDQLITIKATNQAALDVLEKVLTKAQLDDFSQNAWQLSEDGLLEVGPKSRLNRAKRLVMYDINDLLLDLPRYDEVPEIDLNSVLQSGQGGGGQSPFRDDQGDQNEDRRTKDEKAQDIVDIIQQFVETDQWVDNGGEGGTIRHWNGVLLINAPDYMHRQIGGYSFWPSTQTHVSRANGRRYVSLNMDTGWARAADFAQVPVTAIVNGQPVSSGGGG